MKTRKRKIRLIHRKYPQDHLLNLYRFLESYQEKHKYMPSQVEVALKYKTHRSSVGFWYKLMEEQKMVKLHPGVSRAVVLLPLPQEKTEPLPQEVSWAEK